MLLTLKCLARVSPGANDGYGEVESLHRTLVVCESAFGPISPVSCSHCLA